MHTKKGYVILRVRKRFIVLGLAALGCLVVMGTVLQPNIDVNNLHCFISAIFDGNVTMGNAVGDAVTYNAGTHTFPNVTTINFDAATVLDGTGQGIGLKGTWSGGSLTQFAEVPFAYTDDGSSGSGISVPASANILDVHLLVTTDFTSGGTPSIDIGFTGDKNELVDGIDIDTQDNILLPPPTATIDKWAACTGGDVFVTCTTCTAGAGTIRIVYAVD